MFKKFKRLLRKQQIYLGDYFFAAPGSFITTNGSVVIVNQGRRQKNFGDGSLK